MTNYQCRILLKDIVLSCFVLEIYKDGPTIQCVSERLMVEARKECNIPTPKPTPLYDSHDNYAAAIDEGDYVANCNANRVTR